jgi:hypothetical protein
MSFFPKQDLTDLMDLMEQRSKRVKMPKSVEGFPSPFNASFYSSYSHIHSLALPVEKYVA